MHKAMRLTTCGALLVAVLPDSAWNDTADARPQYKKAFDSRYVQQDSRDPLQASFSRRVEKVGCAVCHTRDAQGRVEKTARNAYGNAFGEHLGRKNTQDGSRISRALNAAEHAKTCARRDDSPSFGQRIESGRLPVGDD